MSIGGFDAGHVSARLTLDNSQWSRGFQTARQDLRGFGQEVQSAGRDWDRTAQQLQSTGARMSIGVTAPLLAAGGAMLKAAGDAETSSTRMRVTFGETFDQMQRDLQGIREIAPAAMSDLQNSASDAMGALVTLGVEQGRANEMTREALEVTANLSAHMDRDFNETLRAVQAGYAGNTQSLRDMAYNITQAEIDLRAFEMGLVDQGEAAYGAERAQAVHNLVVEQSAGIMDAAERQTGTFNHELRGLWATVQDVSASIGENLLPHATGLLEFLESAVERFGELDERTQQIILGLGGAAALAGPAMWGAGTLIQSGRTIGEFLGRTSVQTAQMTVTAGSVQVAGGGIGTAGRGAAAAGTGGAAAGAGLMTSAAILAALGIPAWLVTQAEQDRFDERVDDDDSFMDRWGIALSESWEAQVVQGFTDDVLPAFGDAIGWVAGNARDAAGLGASGVTPNTFGPDVSTPQAQRDWVTAGGRSASDQQFMEQNILDLPTDQFVDPSVTAEIEAQADARRRHVSETERLLELNTTFQIQATDPAVRESILSEAEAAVRLREAQDRIGETVQGLAGAYQITLDVQTTYGRQLNEYSGQLGIVQHELDILQEKEENGIKLTTEEVERREDLRRAVEIFTGATRDASEQQGDAAIASADLIDAQWNLQEILDGNTGSAEDVRDRFMDYFEALTRVKETTGENIEMTDDQKDAFGRALDIIDGDDGLLRSIIDYGVELGLLPEGVETELILNDASAWENLRRIREAASDPVMLPVNVGYSDDRGTGQVNYASGGEDVPSGWAWVGEKGRELMWVPGGSTIVPHGESERMVRSDIRGFANGTGTAQQTAGSGPDTVAWDWLFGGMPFAADQATSQTMEALQDLAKRIRDSWGGPTSQAISRAIVDGLDENLDRIPEMVDHITPEVVAEFSIMRNGIEDELQLARIVGDDEKVSELNDELSAINEVLLAWAEQAGIGARDAMGKIVDADAAIDEMAQVVDEWDRVLSNISEYESGDVYRQILDDIDEIDARITSAERHGAPQFVIDALREERQIAVQELHEAAEIYRTAMDEGLAMSPETRDEMDIWGPLFADFGDIVSGDAEADLNESISELRDKIAVGMAAGVPQQMIDQWEAELAAAEDRLASVGEIAGTAMAMGIGDTITPDIDLEELITPDSTGKGRMVSILDTETGETRKHRLGDDQSFEDLLDIYQERHGGRYVPDMSGVDTSPDTDWVARGWQAQQATPADELMAAIGGQERGLDERVRGIMSDMPAITREPGQMTDRASVQTGPITLVLPDGRQLASWVVDELDGMVGAARG